MRTGSRRWTVSALAAVGGWAAAAGWSVTAGPGAPGAAAARPGPVVEARAEVRNGAAGHDAAEATFPTAVEGEAARHVLAIENGCGLEGPRCGHLPVAALSVSLNGTTLFQGASPREVARLEVALNPAGGAPNRLVVRSGGEPGSRARVIISSPGQPPQPLGGRAVLAMGEASTALAVHNAGAAPLAYRAVFYRPDGTEAGRSGPRRLEGHAGEQLELAEAAAGLDWRRGPVHLLWGSRGETRLAAAASTGGAPGQAPVALPLDELPPHPVSGADLADRTGGLVP